MEVTAKWKSRFSFRDPPPRRGALHWGFLQKGSLKGSIGIARGLKGDYRALGVDPLMGVPMKILSYRVPNQGIYVRDPAEGLGLEVRKRY